MEPKKVLVIEDDKAISNVLGQRLEGLGYRVMRAETATLGMQMALDADIVFLDLRLPDYNGEIWLERIRASGNYVPVIAMSAILTREEAEERLGRFQIIDFLEKPFTLQQVAEKAGRAAEVAEQIRTVGVASDRIKGFIDRQNGKH